MNRAEREEKLRELEGTEHHEALLFLHDAIESGERLRVGDEDAPATDGIPVNAVGLFDLLAGVDSRDAQGAEAIVAEAAGLEIEEDA